MWRKTPWDVTESISINQVNLLNTRRVMVHYIRHQDHQRPGLKLKAQFFAPQKVLNFSTYKLQSVDILVNRRKKRITVPQTDKSTKSTNSSTGRPTSKPFWEFFIGMADKVISLMRVMNSHGRLCSGEIYFRRTDTTTKRFSLSVKCTCSLNKSCIQGWQSTSEIRVSKSVSYPVPDILYALGVCTTPNTMAHSDQLLTSMLLKPPSRNLLKEIIRIFVDPYLTSCKQNLISAACEQLRSLCSSRLQFFVWTLDTAAHEILKPPHSLQQVAIFYCLPSPIQKPTHGWKNHPW